MSNYHRLKKWSATLEEKWSGAKKKNVKFCEFACKELMSIPSLYNLNLDEILSSFMTDSTPSKQSDASSQFGAPPVTIFMSSDKFFYLDMYVWPNTHTSAHEHNFEGAFVNIQGDSIQTIYSFNSIKQIGKSSIGKLHKKSLDYIKPFQVKIIKPKGEFIHRVIHIDKPTVSLVLRSSMTSASTPQMNYNFDFLASPGFPEGHIVAKLRCLQYLIENNKNISFEYIKNIIPYQSTWAQLASKKETQSLLTKVSLYCEGVGFQQNVIKENLFNSLLSTISKKEHFIFFIAYDFDSRSFPYWIKENFEFDYEQEKRDFIRHICMELKKRNISLEKSFLKDLSR